jgi:hypothetical protein
MPLAAVDEGSFALCTPKDGTTELGTSSGLDVGKQITKCEKVDLRGGEAATTKTNKKKRISKEENTRAIAQQIRERGGMPQQLLFGGKGKKHNDVKGIFRRSDVLSWSENSGEQKQ